MLNLVRIWILLSTVLVSAGWILSAFHELNLAGYLAIFALATIAVILWLRHTQWRPSESLRQRFWKIAKRRRHAAPCLFALLALMSLVSGLLYPPYNSDTFSYRLPRILHWLGQGQWHWIRTTDMRMNVAGSGYEWMATPLVLFTRTDRFLFLLNWIPFLMLPGLIFYILKHLGTRLRVAWWWAWLLASGWCYVTQAASISNDGFGAVYSLAMVVLAIKSGESGKMTDLWFSMLAAALLTGIKQTNLPLVLLWAVAAAPQWRNILKQPLAFLTTILFGVLVSAAPTIALNYKYTGTWFGLAAIQAQYPDWHIELDSPFWGIIGNSFCLLVQNLAPPFFPLSSKWNHAMDGFLTTSFGTHFKSFEQFGALSPGISESSAGIGLAITLLALISILAALKMGGFGPSIRTSKLQWALRLLPWFLLLVFMAKVGERQNARHLGPYYIFFFPSLLYAVGNQTLVRKLWWQRLALFCMATSVGLLVTNTNRPLFPADAILSKLQAGHPQSRALSQLQKAYDVPASFVDLKHQLKKVLPADERLVGYAAIGNAESEPTLWLPFGSRQVERVLRDDTPEQLNERGIRWIVIQDYPSLDCRDINTWMQRYNATMVSDLIFQGKSSGNNLDHPSHVYVMRLNPPG